MLSHPRRLLSRRLLSPPMMALPHRSRAWSASAASAASSAAAASSFGAGPRGPLGDPPLRPTTARRSSHTCLASAGRSSYSPSRRRSVGNPTCTRELPLGGWEQEPRADRSDALRPTTSPKMRTRSLSSRRSLSSAPPHVHDDEYDDDYDGDGDAVPPSVRSYGVRVVQDGDAVSIKFPVGGDNLGTPMGGERMATKEEEESTFDAPWLWSNRPTNALPSSGQKTQSPGEFPGWRVASASVVVAAAGADAGSHDSPELQRELGGAGGRVSSPAPPPGSCHPIGNLFGKRRPAAAESMHQQQSPNRVLLRVTWDTCPSSSTTNEDDGSILAQNVSYFDMDWLAQWRYDDAALRRRRERTEVTPEGSIGKDGARARRGLDTGSGLVEIEFDDVASDQDGEGGGGGLLALFEALFNDGVALIRNAPRITSDPTTTPVAVLGRALAGSLSHGTLYGDVFHVRSTPDAINIAYTSLPCRPHQDLAYYESPPGVQLLHCVAMSPDIVGGESLLIDAMAAAEELRRRRPEYFRTLVTCPATFVKQRDGACMTYLRPHIVLREGPDLNDMDREIVGVNWSPPFEGPLCLPSDRVREYYRAYAAFERMLDGSLPVPPDDENDDSGVGGSRLLSREEILELSSYARERTWVRSLRPGEVLVFSNRRMLHGRRGFVLPQRKQEGDGGGVSSGARGSPEEEDAGRHLVGAYANIDDALNRYRSLLQEGGVPPSRCPVPNVGNGTTLIP